MGQSWRLSSQERPCERWRLVDIYIDRCRPSPGWVRPSGWTQTKIGKDCGPRGGERRESRQVAGSRLCADEDSNVNRAKSPSSLWGLFYKL